MASNPKPIIRRRPIPSRRRRDGLLSFANDITSQNGEDGILKRIFDLLPPQKSRFCVDVGAWDGVHLSNTYSLLVNECTEWKGVLIEADRDRYEELQKLHSPLGNTCLNVAVSCHDSSPHSLPSLLKQHAPWLPNNFDFLCIDVDGIDYWVMHSTLEEGFHPMVICVEFNPTMPDDVIYIPARDDNVRHGTSLAALVELATSQNYTLIETTLYNAFFIDKLLYERYLQEEVPDTSIEALHETSMGTSLYQLYDGTLKLSGCKKMLWHRMTIQEDQIQMLPAKDRHFPFAPSTSIEQSTSLPDLDAIDISPYLSHQLTSTKEQCNRNLHTQFQKHGFAYIHGTGISSTTCQNALRETCSLLQNAPEPIRRSCFSYVDRARRGYSPMNTENFASLRGLAGVPNDLVRKFRVGPMEEDGSSPLLRPNIWPDGWDGAESFRNSVTTFYNEICHVAEAVLHAICDGIVRQDPSLKSSLSVLSSKTQNHTSILTLLNYKKGSRHKGKFTRPLVAAHTDVGVITVLIFDDGDCATLQRKGSTENEWINVTLPKSIPPDPIFVVNIGDCLSDLSGGVLPSTLHRVMPLDGMRGRSCCALFVGLDPRDRLVLPGGEEMMYEEWRKRRIARAMKALQGDTT